MIDELNQRKKKIGNRYFITCLIVAAVPLGLFAFIRFHDGEGLILPICGVVFTVSIVLGVIRMVSSRIDAGKKIRKFCDKTPDPVATMARLEQTWRDGLDFKYGKMDSEFIIVQVNFRTSVISLRDAVWVYGIRQSVNFIPSGTYLYVHYKEAKRRTVSLSGIRAKYLDMILTYVYSNCPHIYVGNDFAIAKIYRTKNWDELLRYAQMQRSATI